MIDREDRDYYLQCDYCPHYEGPFFDFDDTVTHKKVTGWRSIYSNKLGWMDQCPECSKQKPTKSTDGKSITINFLGG